MSKIIPFVLRELRTRNRLTQDELATKAKLNKQTICRLEAAQGSQEETRPRTIEELAQALNTDPKVLIGDSPLPEVQDESAPADMTRLNFKITMSARNSLFLMSQRYQISEADIIELAPFLFCWAAEASLRRRKEAVARAETSLQLLQAADAEIDHLETADHSDIEDKLKEEKLSIRFHDIWGKAVDRPADRNDRDFDNPFAVFLETLSHEIDGETTFDGYPWLDWPVYRLCPEDVRELVGGDTELTEAILDGHIALHQMPKEIRGPDTGADKTNERAAWARSTLEAFNAAMVQR